MTNVGHQDGEETLSEMHERECRAFNAQMEHQNAVSTAMMSEASKNFGKASIYKAIAVALQVAAVLGGIEGAHLVFKWW